MIELGVPSSSVIVVVTSYDVPSASCRSASARGLEMANVNVSSDSSSVSSVVWTVNVCDPVAACEKVSVPELAVVVFAPPWPSRLTWRSSPSGPRSA